MLRGFESLESPDSKLLIFMFLLLANIGRVIESKELQEAFGWKAEWAHRAEHPDHAPDLNFKKANAEANAAQKVLI
jgi:hypothetical protein